MAPNSAPLRWLRLDLPGHEESSLEHTPDGWRLTGHLEVEENGHTSGLSYVIECDPSWHTRSADILDEVRGKPLAFHIASDAHGHWTLDKKPMPALTGAEDIDLGFSPATNTLPIRRLGLAVGESAFVCSAWLRFPELRLEPLDQIYTREAELVYCYRTLVDGTPFSARLEVDEYGRVLRYEGLWEAV